MKRKFAFLVICVFVSGLAEAGAAAELFAPSLTTTSPPNWAQNEIIVKFKSGASKELIARTNQRHGASVLYTSPFAGFKRIKVPPGKTAKQLLELYNYEPDVEYAELNYYAYALFTPNDPYYVYQWNFYDANNGGINMQAAWDIATGEPNVIVAVLDTGVAYEDFRGFQLAPDLANTRFVTGYDFASGDSHPNDDDGHGTHVTGTIAQSTNNSLGAAGIAFDCSIMPVKVLSKRGQISSGSHADIADGIYFAADNGAHIINMSLGGESPSITLENALAYACGKDITIVCAAGNEYEYGNPVQYPAGYDEYCIAVGATRYDLTRASYSSTGSYLDIAAPGGDLDVDQNGDGYGDGILQQTFGTNPKDWGYWFYTGTSMATAHISGVAALLISTGVTDPNAVREALEETAEDLGPQGWDEEYGWGLVDAYAALNYYRNPPGDLSGDGLVDFEDLKILTGVWLLDAPVADIAPLGGDGIVNCLDFAKLAQDWTY